VVVCGVVGEDRVDELHGVEHVIDQGNRLLLRTGGGRRKWLSGRFSSIVLLLFLLITARLPPSATSVHGQVVVHTVASSGAGRWSLLGAGRLPADEPGVASQCANLFEKLDDGGGGGLLEARLVPHQLVHGVAKIGRRVPQRICRPSAPHGRQVVGGEQHLEEPLEGLALNEGLQAAGVETERGEDVGKAGEHLPGGGDVLHQQGLQHHVRQTFVLKTGQQRGLLEHIGCDNVCSQEEQRWTIVFRVADYVFQRIWERAVHYVANRV